MKKYKNQEDHLGGGKLIYLRMRQVNEKVPKFTGLLGIWGGGRPQVNKGDGGGEEGGGQACLLEDAFSNK